MEMWEEDEEDQEKNVGARARTLQRRVHLLDLLQRHNRNNPTTAEHIRKVLADYGIDYDVQTIQRDLRDLKKVFTTNIHRQGKKNLYRWYWTGKPFSLPREMSPVTTLAFVMMDRFIQALMPRKLVGELRDYFNNAQLALNLRDDPQREEVRAWLDKIFVVPPGPPLLAPEVDSAIVEVVQLALLKSKRVKAIYRNHDDYEWAYPITPLALLMRDNVSYLVATVDDYTDPRILALHRLQQAELLDEPAVAPEGFDVKAFLQKGAHDIRLDEDGEPVKLVLRLTEGAAKNLREVRLSEDQSIGADEKEG